MHLHCIILATKKEPMEIQEIKQQLSIQQVLSRYGHKPNRHNMINYPFHKDKTPSMQVYPETNTAG
ncbi:MAG: CHC2 zinc finger domain-containing protein [bacterium]